MPLPSPYRNPGRWRAVIFQREVRHGTAGCLLSLVLLAPLLVRTWGLGRVVAAVLLYSCLLVPALTNYFSASRLLLRVLRLLNHAASPARSTFYPGLATSLSSSASRLIRWFGAFVRRVLRCFLRAASLPFVFTFGCALPLLHTVYLSFEGFRVTSNQVVFFLMMQELVTPLAYLTALYFLLFYTVLHYLHKALFGRQWVRMVETTQQQHQEGLVVRLAARYIASRLAKGVAMSFVLVMFTLQFSHVEPDLLFVGSTFGYFVITQRKWTGTERIVSWVRALRLEPLEEEEEFWVPLLLALGLPAAASACAAAPLAAACPRMVMVAAYTNLLVPGLLLRKEYLAHRSQHSVLADRCTRATPQEASGHSPCPVCLEELRQARVTPCHHYYHAACLRRCLLLSPLCPLCKQII